MTRAWLAAIAASVTVVSCASRAFVRPSGPGTPAPDAATLWAEATAACRPVTSYAGALGLTGLVGRQRIRGLASATLDVAVTAAGQIGLEARVSGQLAFRLGGSAERAVLLIEDRDVTARADDIVEALIGIKIGPERLLAILTGCTTTLDRIDHGSRFPSDVLQVTAGDTVIFLARRGDAWRPRAGSFGVFEVDYRRFSGAFPQEIRLASRAGHTPAVALTFNVRSFELNPPLAPGVFAVAVPEGAGVKPMSLQELRESGPLGSSTAR
jgi:hypothetical protein